MSDDPLWAQLAEKDAEIERKREEISYQCKLVSGLEQKLYDAKMSFKNAFSAGAKFGLQHPAAMHAEIEQAFAEWREKFLAVAV
jgi:hypothetical protein